MNPWLKPWFNCLQENKLKVECVYAICICTWFYKTYTGLAKKTGHLNFIFAKTLPGHHFLIAQWRAMAYSKACFLSYKMCYHLNLKLLTWGQEVTGKKKYIKRSRERKSTSFFIATILGRKWDEHRNNLYSIV